MHDRNKREVEGCSRSNCNLELVESKDWGQKCTRSSVSQNEFVVFPFMGHDPKATRYYETNPQGHKQ